MANKPTFKQNLNMHALPLIWKALEKAFPAVFKFCFGVFYLFSFMAAGLSQPSKKVEEAYIRSVNSSHSHSCSPIHASPWLVFSSNFCIEVAHNYWHNFSSLLYPRLAVVVGKRHLLISSPEPKVHVSFFDQICPLSVVVIVVVNFSHFHLLLQNHRANFNQTWQKASLGKGDSSLCKWRAPFFSLGR